MTKLEHDPKTKQQVKDALFAFIYEPVERQFKTRIDTLIARNTIIGGYSHKHFIYKGVLYNADISNVPVRKNRLSVQLRPLMDEYLQDQNKLNNEELPKVLGFINQVLNSSPDLEDYLRVLPESVHQPIKALALTCPCRATQLLEERVAMLKETNAESIQLIRQRLVTNLLV